MGLKHFWPKNSVTKSEGYCVNSYGALHSFIAQKNSYGRAYETVWLNYQEIEEILNLKTKEERYTSCDKLFNKKFPQPEKEKKELSKEEQSKLEKLFP